MAEDDNGISDELLIHAEEYIKELLKNKRLKTEVRAQLEIQSYFLMFLAADHDRIGRMYPFFQRQMERQKRTDEWWGRLQWIIIPIAITYAISFIVNTFNIISTLYQSVNP